METTRKCDKELMMQIKDIKKDQIFWYSTQQGNYQCRAKEDAREVHMNGKMIWICAIHIATIGSIILAPDIYGREYVYEHPAYIGVKTYYLNN